MKLFIIIFSLAFSLAFSQDTDYLQSDRPDQSEGTQTLAMKTLHIENGFVISGGIFDNEMMLRYGLFKKTEIRLDANVQADKTQPLSPASLTFSIRQNIADSNGILPSVAALGYLSYIPQSRSVESDLLLAFENPISNQLSLTYNVGSSNGFGSLFSTFEINYFPHAKLGIFAEYFANFTPQNTPNHNVDMGIMYALTPDLQLDGVIGRSLFHTSPNFFFGAGISYRMKTQKRQKPNSLVLMK